MVTLKDIENLGYKQAKARYEKLLRKEKISNGNR